MNKGERGVIVLTVIVIAIILVGEYATYGNIYHYDSSADSDGTYSVYDSGSHGYNAILSDNGTFNAPSKYYVYYDESYGSVVHDVKVEVGAKALTQDYYLSQLINNLEYYSVTDITYVNAEQLSRILADVTTAGSSGLIVASGALPSTVYSGTSSDLIVKWINAGGRLYWAGESLGKYVGNSDGTVHEVSDGESCFTGVSGCINDDTSDCKVYSKYSVNNYCDALCLKNNTVKYSVDVSKLACQFIQIGYCSSNYSSITMFQCGNGEVCVMAGDYSNNQRMDFATIIASGICYDSEQIDWDSGTVARGTVSGRFDSIPVTHGNLGVFIYLGGDFSVYGKYFEFPSA